MKSLIALTLLSTFAYGQYNSSQIFSHNDYLQPKPLESAYNLKVGYVEADVFLREGKLLVAHTQDEINSSTTLESLYLSPLENKIKNNDGNVFADPQQKLTLMIDLKSEGISTLTAIVNSLENFRSLKNCKTLTIAISGNVPDTAQWKNFPPYIMFDGRPQKNYSPKHLQRVSFISDSFNNYSSWNGTGKISNSDRQKMQEVIMRAKSQGKKIRFWGTPDVPNVWDLFVDLGVDILGTDKIAELEHYLKNR